MHKPSRGLLVLLVLGLVSSLVHAGDPPDSRINLQSGFIETADSTWTGSNFAVRYTISSGDGKHEASTPLSSDPADNLDPRITGASNGDSWVVWWRSGSAGTILIRKRTYAAQSWGSERTVGSGGEDSRHPRITQDGTSPWIVYEVISGSSTSVAVAIITDDPVPIGTRTITGSTTFAGDLDPTISAESDHLWVTWVDSASNVGWASYNYTTQLWSDAAYESYAADDVGAARGRIRHEVLGE